MNKPFDEKVCPTCGEKFLYRQNENGQRHFTEHMNKCSQNYRMKWQSGRYR